MKGQLPISRNLKYEEGKMKQLSFDKCLLVTFKANIIVTSALLVDKL